MTTLIENPDPELKRIWGPLAHVSEEERKRILNLGFGQFKPEVKSIEKALKDLAKKKGQQETTYKKLHRYGGVKRGEQ